MAFIEFTVFKDLLLKLREFEKGKSLRYILRVLFTEQVKVAMDRPSTLYVTPALKLTKLNYSERSKRVFSCSE
jgi:hypothetical protein